MSVKKNHLSRSNSQLNQYPIRHGRYQGRHINQASTFSRVGGYGGRWCAVVDN